MTFRLGTGKPITFFYSVGLVLLELRGNWRIVLGLALELYWSERALGERDVCREGLLKRVSEL